MLCMQSMLGHWVKGRTLVLCGPSHWSESNENGFFRKLCCRTKEREKLPLYLSTVKTHHRWTFPEGETFDGGLGHLQDGREELRTVKAVITCDNVLPLAN
jgi:hypothetical protein